MQFDDIVEAVGGFGPYQRRLLLLVMFPQLLISIQALLPVFLLSTHGHWCQTSGEQSTVNTHGSMYYDDVTNSSDVILSASNCSIQMSYNGTNTTDSRSCTSWVYDHRVLATTPISDFNLVCDDTILKTHASMAFMGGNLVGSLILGILGDTFGRKPVMYTGAVLLFGSSLACAWSVNFVMYAILRFLAGAATITCITSAMIIAMETVDRSHRALVGVAVDLTWCVGELVLCGAAYLLRDWRHLQIAVSMPGVILLVYWFLLPESARWLLSRGQFNKAMKIINKAARLNKRPLPENINDIKLERRQGVKEIAPVFKSCRLIVRFAIITYLWFTTSISYYGLTFNVGRIGNNIYLDFFINTLFEAVAYVSCLYINSRFGRKTLNVSAFLLAGLACIASMLSILYVDIESNPWVTIALSTLGRMGVSAVFANIFVYSGELFPTTIRSFILATSNVGARIGAVIAPYITDFSAIIGNDFGTSLPMLVFGVLALFAGVLSCFLPETLNTVLPDDMNDLSVQFQLAKKKSRVRNQVT